MTVSNATAGGQGEGQPGAPSQVPGTADPSQGQQDGFWGNFPTVPTEQRESLEPHLKGIQGYITKLEQTYAPFKPLIDGGYDGDSIKAVMNFSEQMAQDPVATTLGLLKNLQQQALVSDELDIDAVRAAAEGREVAPTETGDILEPETPGEGEMPGWAQELYEQNQQLHQRLAQQDQRTQQRTQDALLKRTVGSFRQELGKAGVNVDETFEDPKVAEKWLVANLITHGMDVGSAVKAITSFSDARLRAMTEETTESQPQDLDLPNGVPSAPKRPSGNARDPFAGARAGAQHDLERRIRASAQGT